MYYVIYDMVDQEYMADDSEMGYYSTPRLKWANMHINIPNIKYLRNVKSGD